MSQFCTFFHYFHSESEPRLYKMQVRASHTLLLTTADKRTAGQCFLKDWLIEGFWNGLTTTQNDPVTKSKQTTKDYYHISQEAKHKNAKHMK